MTDSAPEHFRLLAEYNRRANERLYDACAALPDAERRRERPAFFGSIHGTLNHILLGDRLWMERFEGRPVDTGRLDLILYDDFGELRAAREREDERIAAFVAALTPGALAGSIRYRNHEGRIHADPVHLLLAHLFNHQTHHRGQVHDMLSQTTLAPPSLDLHRLLRPDPLPEETG